MSHTTFVLASYGAAALVLGAVLAWLIIDRAATARDLARLEAAGLRRRSQTSQEDETP